MSVRYLDGMTRYRSTKAEEFYRDLVAGDFGDDITIDDFVSDLVNGARDPFLDLERVGVLRLWLDDIEEELVLKARVEGMSWAEIGSNLGRSKQAVWEKYRDPQDGSADDDAWDPRNRSPRNR
jgi:hypothetical protein